MIHSVFIGSDSELISRILALHGGGPRVLDTTFGHGRFWRDELAGPGNENSVVGLDRRMAGDLAGIELARFPRVVATMAADYEHLPFKAHAFDVLICDPPFVTGGGEGSRIKQRYSSNKNYEELILSLDRALPEFERVLAVNGMVVFKIMDLTEGRRRRWSHIDVANLWARAFRLDDVFIKIAPQAMESSTWTTQVRSRVAHSYFMVFKMRRQSRVSRPATAAGRAILHKGNYNDGRNALASETAMLPK